ncbi:YnfA family protein [Roseomonas sp. F4]|jgi:small multidrug resistance family-3 protein|uniref:YnfA family protein n=2 Tax=Falsiroseomonas TaxID=2870713 RepID=A0ABS6HHL0_9PROT|nr:MULTISPECIES: YnfA family protein [Acetobacteraceae]MBU8547227.1 YnfA family protein [Roseomonas oleicola]NKE45259.1 YnfA family protein [Falsiroseomonas frigidaquae]
MKSLAIYLAAAAAEIAGCYAIWTRWRLGGSIGWAAAGVVSLALFGWLLSLTDVESAGRAFAVYGGIYIAASLVWLRAVEGVSPDRWDLIGGAVSVIGALIILYGPRQA